jgi:lipopolysaccharide biosynthesis glycosyltransferase
MKTFHITAASDENYACHIAALIQSLINNHSHDIHFTFHLLSNDILPETLTKLSQNTDDRIDLCIYDISNLHERLPQNIPTTIALTAYARLFLTTILPEDIDRVLYMDCDTIVNGSLEELFTLSLHDKLAGGVLDTLPDNNAKTSIGLSPTDPYFNSGILLIELKKWKEENIQEEFINYLLACNGKVHHHDQGIINHVLRDKMFVLPPKYNLTSNFFSHSFHYLSRRNNPFYAQNEIAEALRFPVIIHYTEGFLLRPWVTGSEHPLRSIYLRYKKLTAWEDSPLLADRRSWYVKLLAYEFLHLPSCCYHLTSSLFSFCSWLKNKC